MIIQAVCVPLAECALLLSLLLQIRVDPGGLESLACSLAM